MPEKKYLIEIPGQEGVAYWGEERFNANKDALLKDHPDAIIAEVGAYSAEDANDNDMYLIDVPGQQGSAYWNSERFKANQEQLMKDYPNARIQRVRGVDYWGEQKADLEKRMDEHNAQYGEFMRDYEGKQQDERNVRMGTGGKVRSMYADYLFDNAGEYATRNKEREALRSEYYNNPAVKREREADLIAIKDMSAKLQEEADARYKQAIGEYQREGGNIAARGADTVIRGKAETQMYNSALNMLKKAQETLEAPSKEDESNGFVNFMKGAGHTFGSVDFWSAGLTEIQDNAKARAAFDRLKKELGTTDISKLTEEEIDQALSPAEKAMVLAFTKKALADYERSEDMSLGYQSGKSAAESLGFMAQFLMTGAVTNAAAKGATSGMAKWLAKNLGNTFVKNAGSGLAKFGAKALQQAGKFALGTTKSLVDAAVRTGLTTTLARSISEQALPNVFEGTLPQASEYVLKGLGDAFIENWSEAYGGVLSKLVSTPATALFGKWGQVIARSPMMKGLERAGFNGYLTEIGEEFFGNAMRSVLKVNPDALKEFTTPDSLIVTATSFLPMSLIGGAVSIGQYKFAGRDLENKAGELRVALQNAGLNINEIDALVDYSQQLSPRMLSERFTPLINRLARVSGNMANAKEVTRTAVNFAKAVARYQAMEGGYQAEENNAKNEYRDQLQQQMNGEQFWTTRELNATNEQGETYTQDEVRVVTNPDGSRRFILGEENGQFAYVDEQGNRGYMTAEEMPEAMLAANNNISEEQKTALLNSMDRTMSLDQFLSEDVIARRREQEAQRMAEERAVQVSDIKAAYPIGSVVPLGTKANPMDGRIVGYAPGYVMVETADNPALGISYERLAQAVNSPIRVLTDEQLAAEEAALIEAQNAERETEHAETPEEMDTAEMSVESASELEQEAAPSIIPMNDDGTVNEEKFLEDNPEAYVEWNDAERQDGGADSLEQLQMILPVYQAQYDQAAKEWAANAANPTARRAAKNTMAEWQDKINRINNLITKYSAPIQEEMLAETAQRQAEQRVQFRERVNEWRKKLGLENRLVVLESEEDVLNSTIMSDVDKKDVLNAIRSGITPGWYNTNKNVAFIYLPHVPSREVLDQTIKHEVLTHFGLANLMTEKEYNELVDKVWDIMPDSKKAYYMSYAGVTGTEEEKKKKAAEEYIAEIAENVLLDQATPEEKSVWQRIVDFVRNIFKKKMDVEFSEKDIAEIIRGNYAKLQENAEQGTTYDEKTWKQENIERFRAEAAQRAAEQSSEQAESVAPEVLENGTNMWSTKTYAEGGRAYLDQWLAKDDTISEEDHKYIMDTMDLMFQMAEGMKDKFPAFSSWSDAEVEVDENGEPIMSVIKTNGDYSMNLDFSLVCKKRRALNALLNRMIKDGMFEGHNFNEKEIARINQIIQKHGFEVACALCFVDAKRYRVANVAFQFTSMYNDLVKSLVPKGSGYQVAWYNYMGNPVQADMDAVKDPAMLISNLPDEALDWTKIDKILKGAEGKKQLNVEEKIARLLKSDAKFRKNASITDFISDKGFELVTKHNPELLSLYNSKKGTGGPKASLGDVQYLNDILKSKTFTAEKAYKVGGVRVQSFSDYMPHMFFDYMQMMAELAAKRLPAHAYTKEPAFARLFGMTGMKINLSLVPRVEEDGVAPGLDAEGNYTWAVEYIDEEGRTIATQTFPPEVAFEMQKDPRYSGNVGAIAVGISDEHIIKMLGDENIHFIIPYHKSSLNPEVAKMTKIDRYEDYTNTQTEKLDLSHPDAPKGKLTASQKNAEINKRAFDFYGSLAETNDPKQTASDYLAHCKEVGLIPKFPQFAYHENYYKLLVDFNTYDFVTGEYSPQGAVTMTFPENMVELIEESLVEDQQLDDKLNAEIGEVAEEVYAEMGTNMFKTAGRGAREILENYNSDQELVDMVRTALENGDIQSYTLADRVRAYDAEIEEGLERGDRFVETDTIIEGILNDLDTIAEGATTLSPRPEISAMQSKVNAIAKEMNQKYGLEVDMDEWAAEDKQRYLDAISEMLQTSASHNMYSTKAHGGLKLSSSSKAVARFDATNGTDVKGFFEFLRNNKKVEKGKPSAFHIANAGELLNKYGIKGKFMVGQFTFSKEHTKDNDHELGIKEWVDVINQLNNPIAITSYKGEANQFRIYTYAIINGQTICVGVTVSKKDNTIDLSNIITAFGRDVANLLGQEKVYLLYPATLDELEQRISQVSTGPNPPLNATSSALTADKGSENIGKSNENGNNSFKTRITPEQDAAYLKAVEAGDMETAQRMVIEAAKIAMPNTKVVDEDGNPKVVYHQTNAKVYINRETGQNWDDLNWKEKMEWDERDDWEDYWEEQDFNTFSRVNARTTNEFDGFFFAPKYDEYHEYGDRTIAAFVNIQNPASREDYNIDSTQNDAGRNERIRLQEAGFDGVIRFDGEEVDEYIAFEPSQIKSAEPVTYDNDGNVIPLSERFNDEKDDIRFKTANTNQAIFVSNAAKAVEGIKMEKATPEQWLKMIEKNGGLKAGEDKWMGLSDFLKSSDKKTLTKQEVLDFVNEHMIQIEEQHYSNEEMGKASVKILNEKYQGWEDAFTFEWDGYMEEPSADISDYEAAVELYNKHHDDKVALDEDGEFEDMDTYEKVRQFGVELSEIYHGSKSEVRPIDGTREQYTTQGLQHLHEIALTVPTIESWGLGGSNTVHFEDAGDGRAVAWIRFGETQKLLGTTEVEGKKKFNWAKVLVIDEIQSKRHQEGREKGYRVSDIEQWLSDNNVEVVESGEFYEFIKNGETDRRFSKGLMNYDIEKAKRLYVSGYNKSDIPDAPFEKNWHELAMKRMLRYAAENGYDVVAWTKGDQQADRYNLGKIYNEIEREDNPNIEGRTFSFSGGNYDKVTVNEDGVVVDSTIEEAKGKPLSDLVGKDLAVKMMSLENYDTIDGEDLRIGGEGMKGFYDRMLPAFMNKYGKKWGVKVEDIHLNLEGGLDMHSVPVTEEMKESVMEGQTMFKTRQPNQTAESFYLESMRNYVKKYGSRTIINVMPLNEETAKKVGHTLEELQYVYGEYLGKDGIAIFAREDVTESDDVDILIYHETIHHLANKYPELVQTGKMFWEWADHNRTLAFLKSEIEEKYPNNSLEKNYEEMLCYSMELYAQEGELERLISILDGQDKKNVESIVSKTKYGKQTTRTESDSATAKAPGVHSEENRRGSKGSSDEDGKAGAGNLYRTEISPEVRREMDVISAQAIVNGNYMKAPNGKESKLTPDQWALVRTKNFKEWFGDWENDPVNASKVVDENGEPMVVWRASQWGSNGDYTVFDKNRGGNYRGFYFTNKESAEKRYGGQNMRGFFINLRNPDLSNSFNALQGDHADIPNNDGLIFNPNDNLYDEDYEVKVFEPNQIKSATDNTGEFSESSDIRFKTVYGGNSGYVGYSMSRRAAEARSEGRYPKTDFRKEYNVTAPALDLLVSSGIIDGNEWHHTSMYGNRTKFYGWYEDEYADIYTANKKEIDALAREYKKEDEEFRGSGKANREKLIAGEITPQEEYELNREASDKHYAFQREVEDKIDAIFNPVQPDGSGDETTLFKTRTAPAPTKTQDVYKLMRLGADGKLYPLFIGSAEPIELGTWYDAESPNLGDLTNLASGVHLVNNETGEAMTLDEFKAQHPEITIKGKRPNVAAINWATENGARWIEIEDKATAQRRYEGESRSYYNLGINGSGQVGQFAMRPGWHAGSLPTMRQIGKGKDKNLRDDSFVWVKGRIPADVDYQSEADANPDKDIPTHIPTDGFYMKATNANAKASQADKMGWYVAGSFIADEIISDAEARSVIDSWNAEHPDAQVEYDYERESGREYDPKRGGLVEKEGTTMFKTTGTPTEQVVNDGLVLSTEDFTNLAANIYSAMPEDVRRKVVENAARADYDLKKATFQMVASLAEKKNLSDEEIELAKMVAQKVEDAVIASGVEMTRPFTTNEALWMLYQSTNPTSQYDLIGNARKAVVTSNLGFSKADIEQEKEDASEVMFKRMYVPQQAVSAADAYTQAISYFGNRLNESFVDQFDAVNHLIKAIEDATGKKAETWEDIRLVLNQSASKGLAKLKEVERDLIQKMWDAVNELAKAGVTQERLARYVILKHGLERNEVFAARDARNFYEAEYRNELKRIKNDSTLTDVQKDQKRDDAKKVLDDHLLDIQNKVDAKYLENRKTDYSGVKAMFADYPGLMSEDNYSTPEEYRNARRKARVLKYKKLSDAEAQAEMECDAFEVGRDNLVKGLWDSINNLTRGTLKMQYEYGMLSREAYQSLTGMFKYYVPLRGFADNTGEDLYDYYGHNVSDGYAPAVIGAKGRKSEAESPFGWMAAMAGTAVVAGEKNLAKQALYWFAINRKANDLLKVADVWYVENPAKADEFIPSYPPKADPNNTPAENAQQYADWEQQMEDLAKQGKAVKKGNRLDVAEVAHFGRLDAPEHVIKVNIAGEEKQLIINANPRAAQAINGLLNIETNPDYQKVLGKVLRWMSQVSTGWNPEFWMTNISRDTITAFSAIGIKEDKDYNEAFRRNWVDAWKIRKLLPKLKDGTLGSGRLEDLLREAVENGVQTGYSHIKAMEEWDREMSAYIKELNKNEKKAVKGLKNFVDKVQNLSEAMELISRFATYITSREMGRDIAQSVSDAKEVTVNFNRKGSGMRITFDEAKKLKWANGKPIFSEKWTGLRRTMGLMSVAYVSGLSALAPFGRKYMMFFNAGIQGLNMWLQLMRDGHGKQIGAMAGGAFAIGLLNSVIAGMLDGDDDDYQQSISDYERRTNLMLGANGFYLKVALPQELRAFYGLGDILYNYMAGNYHHKDKPMEIVRTVGNQLFEMLPINPMGGWQEFVPQLGKATVEAGLAIPLFGEVIEGTNMNFAGIPLRDEKPWLSEDERESMPKYTFAGEGTWNWLVRVSELANRATGGTEYDAGWLQLDPARIQHYTEAVTGGIGGFVGKLLSTVDASMDPEKDVEVSKIPFLNKVFTVADERGQNKLTNQQYYYYKGVAERSESRYYKYLGNSDKKYARKEKESDDFKIWKIFRKYEARQESYNERLKRARNAEEEREIKMKRDANRKEFLNALADKGLL